MKPEIAQEWLKALRSGEYKQTKKNLHDTNGYCCLGVLCDLAAKQGIGEWSASDSNTFDFLGNGSDLPPAVQRWAGMCTAFGEITSMGLGANNFRVNLASLNDGYNRKDGTRFESLNFEEIADIIELKVSEL